MKIGLLSDTHNNLQNLKAAIEIFRSEDVATVVHCGDLTSSEMVNHLAEFRVLCSFGNGDFDAAAIHRTLAYFNPENFSGTTFQGILDSQKVAVVHGHIPGLIEQLAESGEFTYLFHGHTHRRRDILIGSTRVINPGALGGVKTEPRCCAVFDLSSQDLHFHNI